MNHSPTPTGLTIEGCRARQQALREHLAEARLDAALITDRRHVHYFTGYWCPAVYATVALIKREGSTTLAIPLPREEELAADTIVTYYSNRLGTLVDDQMGEAISSITGLLSRCGKLGYDGPVLPSIRPSGGWTDLRKAIFALRRRKAPDEIALLRRAIEATEAAYRHAGGALGTGVTEVELFAGMQAAAASSAVQVTQKSKASPAQNTRLKPRSLR